MDEQEIDFDSPAFIAAAEEAKKTPLEPIQEMRFDEPITPIEPPVDENAPPITPEEKPLPPITTAEPNYDEWLAAKSDGLFKTEADLIAALDKVKNYDSVEVRAKELENAVPKFKNEETKAWFDLLQTEQGPKVLKDYIAERDKDYATMSDLDVRREALSKEHPQWSKKDIDLELRHKYGKDLELKDTAGLDDEDLEKAEAHNAQVERNLELLAVHARDDRYSLIEKQKLITLPELKKAETNTQAPKETPEQAADRVAKWQKKVEETVPKLSNFKIDIDDKGVEYVWTDEEKAALVTEMKDFNIFKWMESEGWTNKDGSWNPDKIAEGVRFLRDRNKVIGSVAGQVKTEAIRATMAKIKGIDPNYQEPGPPKVFNTLEEAAQDALKRMRAKENNVEREEVD